MNNPNSIKNVIAILIGIIMITCLFGCSEKVVNYDPGNTGNVKISTKLNLIGNSDQVAYGILRVTAADIDEPIVLELALIEGFLVGEVQVPAGRDRTFEVQVYNTSGEVIYFGSTTIDVGGLLDPDTPFELVINLYPQVPMIKTSPGVVRTFEYSKFTIDVKVYNLNNLNEIYIAINYDNYVLSVDSFKLNPALGAGARWSYIDYSGFAISVNDSDQNVSLVDDTGYATLGTIYFSSYNVTNNALIDTTLLPMEALYAVDNQGTEIPFANIEAGGSEAHIISSVFYRSGYWLLDESSGNIAYDSSGNGLNGIATGTTINEGYYGMARYFNGNGDFIEVPDNNLLDMNEGITLIFDIQIDTSFAGGVIFSKISETGNANYMLEYVRSMVAADRLVFSFGDEPRASFNAPASLTDGLWHFVIISIPFNQPAQAFCAVDYQLRVGYWSNIDLIPQVQTNDASLLIGRQPGTDPRYFKGGLDNIEIYRAALNVSMFDIGI